MKTYFVDAFTGEPFKGNPAAVCFPENILGDAHMQQVATEIGFSETAFVIPLSAGRWSIRFFTPRQEIALCGHATLAAAKVLFDGNSISAITFLNINGIELNITTTRSGIRMRFPVYDTEAVNVPATMLEALHIDSFLEARYSPNNRIIMIEISGTEVLAQLQPQFDLLITSHNSINSVLVTAAADGIHFDYHYRYFWPWAGTNEDPVTGGVQTFLAQYWAQKLNRQVLRAFQSSARTGSMTVTYNSDHILIDGEAVIVLEGEFHL